MFEQRPLWAKHFVSTRSGAPLVAQIPYAEPRDSWKGVITCCGNIQFAQNSFANHIM